MALRGRGPFTIRRNIRIGRDSGEQRRRAGPLPGNGLIKTAFRLGGAVKYG